MEEIFLGVFVSIACAFTWSLSVILLKIAGSQIHPVVMNLGKNLLALLLLVPSAILFEGGAPELSDVNATRILLSGFVGIGLADAMVLKAMMGLNASKIAIIECLYSPFVILLSILFLGESLRVEHAIGGVAILGALWLVLPKSQVSPKIAAIDQTGCEGSDYKSVFSSALMAAGILAMAVGIILIKPVFSEVSLLWLVTYRMFAGVVASVIVWWFLEDKAVKTKALFDTQRPFVVLSAFILSSYVSIILWLAGYKYLETSLAAILNQTSTIFTVILAVVVLGEKPTIKKAAAAMLAATGVVIASLN